ncbi:MAG TPA: beta-galactosidase, partial [Phycisphaeraceae bacterium]
MIYSRLAEIWYGGDYSPDQWPDQDWPRDLELFRQARINVVTLPVFSWANLQTDESTYDFDWLDRVLDLLGQHRLRACLATPTAAVPPWMAHQHPQVLRVDFHGRPLRFGFRRNFCPNSPVYREQAARLADRMAQRYHDHPALAAWHVNNEYGQYCYCDRCAAAFQQWLAQRYQTLDELNHRWTTAFWSHRFTAWEQIPPPNVLSEHFHPTRPDISAAPAISLDYHRFMSDSLLACFRLERDAIRSRSDAPITTNLMGTYKPLNYRQWARE